MAFSQRSSFPLSLISHQVTKLSCVGRGDSAWMRFGSYHTLVKSQIRLQIIGWLQPPERGCGKGTGHHQNVRITKGYWFKLLMSALCILQKQIAVYRSRTRISHNTMESKFLPQNCSHHCLLSISTKESAKKNLTSFSFPEFNQPLRSPPWRTWIKLSLLCKLYLPSQAFPLIFSVCRYVILFSILEFEWNSLLCNPQLLSLKHKQVLKSNCKESSLLWTRTNEIRAEKFQGYPGKKLLEVSPRGLLCTNILLHTLILGDEILQRPLNFLKVHVYWASKLWLCIWEFRDLKSNPAKTNYLGSKEASSSRKRMLAYKSWLSLTSLKQLLI